VFLRPRVLITAPLQELRTAIHWSPRIELRRLERVVEHRHATVERVLERHTQTRLIERERLALRLVERGARTEDSRVAVQAASRGIPRPPATVAVTPAPPEMKLNRPPKPSTPEPDASPREARSPFAFPRTPIAPAVDLNRLTDSVMRQIDRRLEAQRERMWRK
jgi:hypothetical protein